MIELINTYLIIALISAFATLLWLFDNSIKGVDSFWDWVIYNLFWIALPIKATIKFIKNILC